MRRVVLGAMIFAVLAADARAWLLYTDRDDPARWIVEIEQTYGDVVALTSLPPPLNTLVRQAGAPPVPVFRWRYGREAAGEAVLVIDEHGRGKIDFTFELRQPLDGQRLGAAVVLVAGDGTPLHTFYARTGMMEDAVAAGAQHRVGLALERTPSWWRGVSSLAFFSMRYYPQQELDDAEVQEAMRRAVGNFTKGRGSEQMQ